MQNCFINKRGKKTLSGLFKAGASFLLSLWLGVSRCSNLLNFKKFWICSFYKSVWNSIYSELSEGGRSRDHRESRLSLSINSFCPVSTGLSLDIQLISQSLWVLVLTSKNFLSVFEFRSRYPRNFSVLMSLGLGI